MAKNSKIKDDDSKKPIILARLQSVIVAGVLSFIPIFIFVILPMLTRNHITSTMNVSKELLLSLPREIALSQKGDSPATFKLCINNTIFEIPCDMTPVYLDRNSAAFRQLPRRISRTLACACIDGSRRVSLQSTGIFGWFMPSDSLKFLQTSLNSTWHPVRLLCKADFLTSQGIGSQIFEASWGDRFIGYIFPSPGATGYIGRIFGLEDNHYLEFSFLDEVSHISLQKWVNIGRLIKPNGGKKEGELPNFSGAYLAETLQKARVNGENQWRALEIALNRYFSKGDTRWILPIATVQESRGFIREVIEGYRKYSASVRNDAHLFALWGDLLNQAVKKIVKIEMDPHIYLNSLVVSCKNLGDFPLRNINVRISIVKGEETRAFLETLFKTESLHPGQEKSLNVVPPQDIVVNTNCNVSWRVTDIEVINN